VQGQQPITVDIGYVYKATYADGASFASAFAAYTTNPPGSSSTFALTGNRATSEITTHKVWRGTVGTWDARGEGLGGWSIDVHHVYDPTGRVLYLGDGRRRSTSAIRPAIGTMLSNGGSLPGIVARPDGSVLFSDPYLGAVRKRDAAGNVSTFATVPKAGAMTLAPDGNLYVASNDTGTQTHEVYKVDTAGNATLIAGGATACTNNGACGDDGKATEAQLSQIWSLSAGPDGSVYVLSGGRVRRVGPDGLIHTVAGTGACSGSTGGNPLAIQANIGNPSAILMASDGNIYISSLGCYSGTNHIYYVTPSGTLATLAGAGSGSSGSSANDGYPAMSTVLTNPGALAMTSDGLLVFADYDASSIWRIRQIDRNGIVTTVAGNPPSTCTNAYCGDGRPATASNIGGPNSIAFGPDGSLLIATNYYTGRILRVSPPLPRFGVGNFVIPSQDAGETYVFDTTGRHLETRDALTSGQKYVFGYDVDPQTGKPDPQTGKSGRLTSIAYVPGSSHVTNIAYDDVHGIRTITSPFGDVTTLTIDGNDNLSSVSHPGGPASAPRTETYSLEATPDGLLVSFADPLGTVAGLPHTLVYDTAGSQATGRLTSDSDPEGGHQTLALQSLTSGATGSYAKVVRTKTGDLGATYSTSYEIATSSDGTETRTNTLPDASHTVLETIKSDGSRTLHMPDGTVVTTSLLADPRFGMLAPTVTRTTTLPIGNLARTEATGRFYDAQGLLHESTVINGTKTYDRSYQYNSSLQTTTVTYTSPEGRQRSETLDAFGRLIQSDLPSFGSTSYGFTSAYGQLASTTYSASGETNRVFGRTFYAASAGAGKAGRVATLYAPLTDDTVFQSYDLAGRVWQQYLPGHGVGGFPNATERVVDFRYDENGNPTEIDPPPAVSQYSGGGSLQAQHVFDYDLVNQLTGYDIRDAADPGTSLGLATTYQYTPDRLPRQTDRPEVDQITYTSAFGRLTGITLPGSSGSVAWGYDAATRQLTSLTGPMGVDLGFGYNGRLMTSVAWSGLIPNVSQETLTRSFDDDFQMTSESVTGAAAATLYFNHDDDGLLTCVGTSATTDCSGGLEIEYASGSTRLAGTKFPYAGTTRIDEAYTPNGFGETLGYAATVGSTALFTAAYSRDDLGRISARSESLLNADSTTSSFDYTYAYDAAGRLTDVTIGSSTGTQLHYDLDANGNRLRRSVEDLSTNTVTSEEFGEYNVQGQITHYNGKTYAYTESGYLHTVTDDATSDVTTYTYDALGNLRRVDFPDSSYVEYVIDGMNRRVAKKVSGTLTKAWIYEDELRIAAEFDFDSNGTTVTSTKRFGYGTKANVPDLMVMDGSRYRILSDHLGSVRMVVSEDGSTIVARMDYDEYGRPAAGNTTGVVPFGFAGGLYDENTHLVRFGARDYDPVTGRWTAKDPLRFDGGQLNLYAYATVDPVNNTDSTGEMTEGQCIWFANAGVAACIAVCVGANSADAEALLAPCIAMCFAGGAYMIKLCKEGRPREPEKVPACP